MREIIFRGKPTESVLNSEDLQDCKFDIVDGFVYGNLITDEHKPIIVGKVIDSDWDYCSMEWWCPVVKETVGQFTGLVDKNGKRIFEGDVISTDLARGFLVVEFKGGAFVFNCNDGEDDYYDHINASHELDNEYKYGEIIGNIHDNMELIAND